MKLKFYISFILFVLLWTLPGFTGGPEEKRNAKLNSIQNEVKKTSGITDSIIRNEEDKNFNFTYFDEKTRLERKNYLLLRSALPAEEFYNHFDSEIIFPNYKLSEIEEVTDLVLQNYLVGNYFHPLCGKVNSPFGNRHGHPHKGIDLSLKTGDPVFAAFDGKVRIAGRQGGFGNTVIIRHYNGLETIYGHLSKICVKEGEVVNAGKLIGKGGSTGNSTGPHLHLELRFKGHPIDPASIISFEQGTLISDTLRIKKNKDGLTSFPKNQTWYCANKGDNWKTVSEKFGINLKDLLAINQVEKRSYLKKGNLIKIQSN